MVDLITLREKDILVYINEEIKDYEEEILSIYRKIEKTDWQKDRLELLKRKTETYKKARSILIWWNNKNEV